MFPRSPKGSVALVALSCVAVLGIALASYLAVSNQAMKLSNRAYAKDVSRHLAEMGLERALRSFYASTFSSWTLSGNTASRTLSISSTNYGNSGLTASINIRVDNYNAYNSPATWVGGTNYRVNDLVGYNGSWYHCVKNHSTSQTPSGMGSLAYWVPGPIPWAWVSNYSYKIEDVICYNGAWYRCTANHVSPATWTVANWTLINSISLWSGSVFYVSGDIVYFPSATTWYLWNGFAWVTPGISWQWKSGTTYSFNDLVCVYDSVSTTYIWYRCILAHTNQVPPNSTYWENALSGSMWSWSSSSINYNIGDMVYYSTTGQRYRCILAHTSSGALTPTNTTYWSNAPLYSTAWDPGRQYSQNDTVRYNGVWYLSLLNSNIGQNPVTATSYWIGANTSTASYQWSVSTAYSVGDYRCYGGVWYKCTTANTGQSPNNTSYWTASWVNSWGITTGAPVIYAQGTVTMPDSSAPIKTELRATVAPAPLFPNAAASTTTLTASSSAGTVDSYDGSVNAISTAGSYTTYTYNQTTSPFAASPNSNIGFSAVLAAKSSATTDLNINNTQVKGYVAANPASTTPYAPLWTYSGSAVLTGVNAGTGIDLTRVSRSPYIPQFDTLPSGGLAANWATTPKGLALTSASTVNLGTPGASTPSRYYINGNLVMGGVSTYITTMNINGPVILYINGDLTMTGTPNGIININSTGSAEIHIAGGLKVDSGSDGIRSYTFDPKTLILICDNSTTTTQFYSEGANPFYGVIYVPNTTATGGLYFNYTDVNNTTVYGAVSAAKLSYQNNLIIHYDTSLRYATFGGMDQPYAITEWRELTDFSEQVTLP